MVKLQKSAQRLELAAPAYRLTFDRERPWLVGLATGTGCPIADLFIGCGVDSVQGRDELGPLQPPRLSREGDATVVTFEGGSSLWDAKRYVLTCRDSEVDLRVEVDGRGRVDRCHFGQGCLPEDLAGLGLGPNHFRDYERPLSDLARGSRPHFQAYYTARPTAAEHDLRLRWEDESIDLTDDPGRHGGCDSFLPAPWAFALELPGDEPWVGIGLAPQPDQLEFGAVRYRGGTTFGFSLDYDGRVSVDGTWVSPALVFSFGARDALGAFRALLASLRERGLVSAPAGPSPGWWSRPAFDGTGQQHWLAETGDP
ncbi:MAG: hypothetical protein HUU35_03150, partial [Armatimonadetes bacterium]|nr:hypothetical protein [Armatimonadota bacterium]